MAARTRPTRTISFGPPRSIKEAVAGPVQVRHAGITGDDSADRENHGDFDKAVLAYSADHYPFWQSELSLAEMPFGGFGENLSIAGVDEQSVCIGDTWQAGEVLFEVSQPRQPCWKLARRWRTADLAKRVVANGKSGWYLRVLAEGTLDAGCEISLVSRPHPEWSIARAADVMYHHQHDRALNCGTRLPASAGGKLANGAPAAQSSSWREPSLFEWFRKD